MNKVIIITGQTATGKTKLALKLAKKNNGELINCDSRQIYKHLDIITGKDRPADAKIWLYDIVDPKQYFSSYDWVQSAIKVIVDIFKRGKTPIIVGGTYLYIKHLLYGFKTENTPPNWQLRKKLEKKSIDGLQKILISLNPQSFNQLNNSDKNNPQRLIRRIEIAKSQPFLPAESRLSREKADQFTLIGLRFKDKKKLRKKIANRVEKRLKNGAIDEVKNLLKKGYTEKNPGLKTIGYHQLFKYLNNCIPLEEAKKQWITKEIQYAKRQYTFMKKDLHIKWRLCDI